MKEECYIDFDNFLNHWDGVRIVTLSLLSCFKNEDLTFQLVPQWRTVGDIFHHIGGHQYYVARGIFERRWEPKPGEPDMDWVNHKKRVTQSILKLSNWLKHVQILLKEWSSVFDGKCLSDVRNDNPWHKGMRGWLLLHHAYQDELHHRGQLYAICRILKRQPPIVYAEEYPEYWDSENSRISIKFEEKYSESDK